MALLRRQRRLAVCASLALALLGRSAGVSETVAPVPSRLPVAFEPNVGQAPSWAGFVAHGGGAVTLFSSQRVEAAARGRPIGFELVGAAQVEGRPLDELPGRANYLIGNDADRWHLGVRTFSRVVFAHAWPGIDLVFHGEAGVLELDWRLEPGAAPEQIRLALHGPPAVKDARGDLRFGNATLRRPVATQWGRRVEVEYVLSGAEVTLRLGPHDETAPLLVDPVVTYSSYLGGNAGDEVRAIGVDAQRHIFIAGVTTSTNFPTAGPLQAALHPQSDLFVARLDATGRVLEYSTYLGGTGTEDLHQLAVDGSGAVSLAGDTSSPDFPTATAWRGSYAGGATDGFAARLAPSGSALLFSTYLGGAGDDHVRGVALDGQSNTYVVGDTYSSDFPTQSPLFTKVGTNPDMVVVKLDPAGNPVYATFLGGSGFDEGDGIAADSAGNAWVVGSTDDATFPTVGALHTFVASRDAVVARLDATGATLLFGTYLGGMMLDGASAVAVDAQDNALIAGTTNSTDFPVSSAPYQAALRGGMDGFVVKLSPSGNPLIYSTYLGGSGQDGLVRLAADAAGNAYLVGSTFSGNFPLVGATQGALSGISDGVLTVLDSAGKTLLFSTFIGGSGQDSLTAVAIDGAGTLLAGGSTLSNTFPTGGMPEQAAFDGGVTDGVVVTWCCGPDAGLPHPLSTSDAGTPDAGTLDGGTTDAGASTPDAGGPDAGASDGGRADAGTTESDAGSTDAGQEPRALAVGCGCDLPGAGPLLVALVVVAARPGRRPVRRQ